MSSAAPATAPKLANSFTPPPSPNPSSEFPAERNRYESY